MEIAATITMAVNQEEVLVVVVSIIEAKTAEDSTAVATAMEAVEEMVEMEITMDTTAEDQQLKAIMVDSTNISMNPLETMISIITATRVDEEKGY